MPNPENITNQTKEQLSANGRKGAAKTNAIKKQKKAMAEEIKLILSLPVKRSIGNAANKLLVVDKAKALDDFSKRNTTVQTQILLKLTQMAMSGNMKAMQLIMELSGDLNIANKDDSQQVQENAAMDFFVRQKVQVDDMKSNSNNENEVPNNETD